MRSRDLSDYEAVDVTWVAIIKLANLHAGKREHDRLLTLLDRIPEDRARIVLAHEAVDALLNLDPPIESVLNMPHEHLDAKRTVDELQAVRHHRQDQGRLALLNLVKVLKRIRNRRAHGFKTPYGLRDQQILRAASQLLRLMGEVSADAVAT